MPDQGTRGPGRDQPVLEGEVARLNKVVQALMDRAERSTQSLGSDFNLFQATVMLEEQVRSRTAELEAALRENEEVNRALRDSEARFRGLVSQSMVGIAIIEDWKFTYSNEKFDGIFGYSADEMRKLGPPDMVSEADRPRVVESIRKRMNGETERVQYLAHGLRKDGTAIDIEIHGGAMNIGDRRVLISLVMDVTERIRAEREVQALQEMLRDQAVHDALTGLYNRRFLEESLRRELIAAERHGYPVSVIMADLDHFKLVNDRHGHAAGDEVLRRFGDLMKRGSRGSDICCRYGGEEFLIVLPQMAEKVALERAEQLCRATAAAPFLHGESQISVTSSFGVATFPGAARTGDDLIAAADRALYAAKAAGRNRVEVSPDVAKQ